MTLLPNEVEHGMVCGPLDSPHDVILRILDIHAGNIVAGDKNHDFRRFRLDADVSRIWLYIDEKMTIQFVLTVGAPKTQGEINDPNGIGNNDFDQGLKLSPFGYPILAVHKLPDALTIDDLYSEFGVDMVTRGKQYVKQALVDEYPLEMLECVVQA